ncbi:MAG: hypothetical protein O3A51_10435, partial [Verrucomicrobia bacterium]|nr:hypothetical protein [Verrucomicrobiota bacterium]
DRFQTSSGLMSGVMGLVRWALLATTIVAGIELSPASALTRHTVIGRTVGRLLSPITAESDAPASTQP